MLQELGRFSALSGARYARAIAIGSGPPSPLRRFRPSRAQPALASLFEAEMAHDYRPSSNSPAPHRIRTSWSHIAPRPRELLSAPFLSFAPLFLSLCLMRTDVRSKSCRRLICQLVECLGLAIVDQCLRHSVPELSTVLVLNAELLLIEPLVVDVRRVRSGPLSVGPEHECTSTRGLLAPASILRVQPHHGNQVRYHFPY